MSALSPLSGVNRKSDFGAVRAAFDPMRTSGHASSCKRKGYGLNAVLQKSGLLTFKSSLGYHPKRIAPS
jgi:hypothetical protein